MGSADGGSLFDSPVAEVVGTACAAGCGRRRFAVVAVASQGACAV